MHPSVVVRIHNVIQINLQRSTTLISLLSKGNSASTHLTWRWNVSVSSWEHGREGWQKSAGPLGENRAAGTKLTMREHALFQQSRLPCGVFVRLATFSLAWPLSRHSAGAICTFQIYDGMWDRFLLSIDAPEDVCPMRGMFLESSWFRTWRQEQDTLRCFIRVGGESSRFFKSEVTLAR